MRLIDRRTISTLGVPGIVLMAYAGKEIATLVRKKQPKRVCVVCGKGNNGGDGWIAAWWLKHWGIDVRVLSTTEPSNLTGDAKLASEMALGLQVPCEVYQTDNGILEADVYVDAILGTGARSDLSAHISTLVTCINQSSEWTVSVDVPTGIDANSGEVPGTAIYAHETVSIGFQKVGTAITPGADHAGKIHVVDIGLDSSQFEPTAEQVTAEHIAAWLPPRGTHTHKGTFGRVGVVVGDMQGAAMLAGLGAARAGAGLVVVGHTVNQLLPAPYEFVIREHDPQNPTITFHDCQALVCGPGLGARLPEWMDVISHHQGPGVLDADGLAIFGRSELKSLSSNWVITPHPKECARLLGWTVDQVQARRFQAAQKAAIQTGAIVVLKGSRTLICTPNGRMRVNPTGDASLATAGTGDVLAGVIGGLLAQGLHPFDAAAAGAWIHGMAGVLSGREKSKPSTMASDVVENISRAISLYFDASL